MKCVVSVLGKDRSGIVAEVATALAECGANIDDISQTILDDIFSMTMLTTLNPEERGGRFYRLFDALLGARERDVQLDGRRCFDGTDVLKGNRFLLGHFREGQAVNRSIISCLECTPSFA